MTNVDSALQLHVENIVGIDVIKAESHEINFIAMDFENGPFVVMNVADIRNSGNFMRFNVPDSTDIQFNVDFCITKFIIISWDCVI